MAVCLLSPVQAPRASGRCSQRIRPWKTGLDDTGCDALATLLTRTARRWAMLRTLDVEGPAGQVRRRFKEQNRADEAGPWSSTCEVPLFCYGADNISPQPYGVVPPSYDDALLDTPPDYTTTDHRASAHVQELRGLTESHNPSQKGQDGALAGYQGQPPIDLSTIEGIREHPSKKKKQAQKKEALEKWAGDGDGDEKKNEGAEENEGGGDNGDGGAGGAGGGDGAGNGDDDNNNNSNNNGGGKKNKKKNKKKQWQDEEENETESKPDENEEQRKKQEEDQNATAAAMDANGGDANPDDEWGFQPTKKGKKGKKGKDQTSEPAPPPPPNPPEAPDAPAGIPASDGFDDIKLDDNVPKIDLSFDAPESKRTGGELGFGGWDSNWGSGSKWDFGDTGASAETKDAKTGGGGNPWSIGGNKKDKKAKDSGYGAFDFGELGETPNTTQDADEAAGKEDDWMGFTTAGKKDKKKKGRDTTAAAEPAPKAVEPVSAETDAADDFLPAWGTARKEKKGNKGANAEVVDDMLVDTKAPEETPATESFSWGSFGTNKKDKKKNNKKGAQESSVAEDPIVVVDSSPAADLATAIADDEWKSTGTGKKGKKGKKGLSSAEPEPQDPMPPPPPPAPLPAPDASEQADESKSNDGFTAWATTSKKDKKKKNKAVPVAWTQPEETEPAVIVPDPEPKILDSFGSRDATNHSLDDNWDSWGLSSSQNKKDDQIDTSMDMADIGIVTVPETNDTSSTKEVPESRWSTSLWGSKTKKGKKGKDTLEVPPPVPTPPVQGLTPGSTPPPWSEPLVQVVEPGEDAWGSFAPVGGKNKKKGKKGATAVEAPKQETSQHDFFSGQDFMGNGDDMTTMLDQSNNQFSFGQHDDNIIAIVDDAQPEPSPPVEEPVKPARSFWGFGGSSSKSKSAKDEEKERAKKEREEKERLEREKQEQERLEREEREREEDERREKERLEEEQREMERQEKERIEQEKQDKKRLEKEKREKEKADKEQAEKERLEKRRQEREKREQEKAEKERAERERKEKLKAEKEEKERELKRKKEEKAKGKKAEATKPVAAEVVPDPALTVEVLNDDDDDDEHAMADLMDDKATGWDAKPQADKPAADPWNFWGSSRKSKKEEAKGGSWADQETLLTQPPNQPEPGAAATAEDLPQLTPTTSMKKPAVKVDKKALSVAEKIKALEKKKAEPVDADPTPEPEPEPEPAKADPPPKKPVAASKSKSAPTKSALKKEKEKKEAEAKVEAEAEKQAQEEKAGSDTVVPGSFPEGADDDIVDVIDLAPTPVEKPSKKKKGGKIQKMDALREEVPLPVPEIWPTPSPVPDEQPPPPPPPGPSPRVPAPAPAPKPAKKERPRVVREESSWGFWGTAPKKDSKPKAKDDSALPSPPKTAGASAGLARSKSARKPSEKPGGEKDSSKSSSSDKDKDAKPSKPEKRPSGSKGMSFSNFLIAASTPPRRTKSRKEPAAAKVDAKPEYTRVYDMGLLSPPPDDPPPPTQSTAKAAKILGTSEKTAAKLARRESAKRKGISPVVAPPPPPLDDIVMIDDGDDLLGDYSPANVPSGDQIKKNRKLKQSKTMAEPVTSGPEDIIMVDEPGPSGSGAEPAGFGDNVPMDPLPTRLTPLRRSQPSTRKSEGIMGLLGSLRSKNRPAEPATRRSSAPHARSAGLTRRGTRLSGSDEDDAARQARREEKRTRRVSKHDSEGTGTGTERRSKTDTSRDGEDDEVRRAERRARRAARDAADREAREAEVRKVEERRARRREMERRVAEAERAKAQEARARKRREEEEKEIQRQREKSARRAARAERQNREEAARKEAGERDAQRREDRRAKRREREPTSPGEGPSRRRSERRRSDMDPPARKESDAEPDRRARRGEGKGRRSGKTAQPDRRKSAPGTAPPIQDYFDPRNGGRAPQAAPRPNGAARATDPYMHGLQTSGTDHTSSWVKSQVEEPAPPPPLVPMVIEAPAAAAAAAAVVAANGTYDSSTMDEDVRRAMRRSRRSSKYQSLTPDEIAVKRRREARRAEREARRSSEGSDQYPPKRRRHSRRATAEYSPVVNGGLPKTFDGRPTAGVAGGMSDRRSSWWKGLSAKIAGAG